ncbi:hypothetical protein RFI_32158 [Reticulomyxa filosa]|uniref:Uncharacterized protein n=1 Tax=Reticulomyxa filosa TaxID=46433 RepID=X6LTH4_RETFI|nr:hypothetical protein RFI_32158 [Reticulomyxa filosa]|eukprot:ETO05238.1 hypothetical protein RFI_32158 [Reticulomyxa filosa]
MCFLLCKNKEDCKKCLKCQSTQNDFGDKHINCSAIYQIMISNLYQVLRIYLFVFFESYYNVLKWIGNFQKAKNASASWFAGYKAIVYTTVNLFKSPISFSKLPTPSAKKWIELTQLRREISSKGRCFFFYILYMYVYENAETNIAKKDGLLRQYFELICGYETLEFGMNQLKIIRAFVVAFMNVEDFSIAKIWARKWRAAYDRTKIANKDSAVKIVVCL